VVTDVELSGGGKSGER